MPTLPPRILAESGRLTIPLPSDVERKCLDSKRQVGARFPSGRLMKTTTVVIGLIFLRASAAGQVQDSLTCRASAASVPEIRAEGVAELVGDIVIRCAGGGPSGADQNARVISFQVFTQPSINITSRLLAPGFSEGLMLFDEPGADGAGDSNRSLQTICGSDSFPYARTLGSTLDAQPGVCSSVAGTGNGAGTYDPNSARPVNLYGFEGLTFRGNVIQARQISNNSLSWSDVPFDAPGTSTERIIRITNVRVNASQLGLPAGASQEIQLFISTSQRGVASPIAIPITAPTPTVAIARPSLAFAVDSPAECRASALLCDTSRTRLRFRELFPHAWRRRTVARSRDGFTLPAPGRQDGLRDYATESGFYRTTTASGPEGERWPVVLPNGSVIAGPEQGTMGLADHGTRLAARFRGVPPGVRLWVDSTPPKGRLVGGARTRTGTPGEPGEVALMGGEGEAIWEILDSDPEVLEEMAIGLYVAYGPNPATGRIEAEGGYAPVSVQPTSSIAAPIPRFSHPPLAGNSVAVAILP